MNGSLRSTSYSLATCHAAAEIASVSGISSRVLDLKELKLPMYIPDWDLDEYSADDVGIDRLLEAYRWAHAILWVSPTYHGTISGVFKNALDFIELLSGDVPPYLQNRPVGLVAINDSTTFSAMRDCARELRAWVAPTQVELSKADFSPDKKLVSERSRTRLARLVDELAAFAFVRT